jgi:hypothetical protein
MAALLIDGASRSVAAGYERVLLDVERLALSKRRSAGSVAARALRCLAEALEPVAWWPARRHPTCGVAPMPWPSRREHYEPTATVIPGLSLDAEKIYKGMLALAAAQPEGFSPVEKSPGGRVPRPVLRGGQSACQPRLPQEEGSWYWVDSSRDMGPVPPNRRIPPDHGDLLYCSFQMLARLLSEQISALEGGMPAGNLRLPERAAGPGGIAALKRLQAHWAHPPHRQHPRRHNNFRAQVCVGLNELWQLLEHGEAPEGTEAGATAHDRVDGAQRKSGRLCRDACLPARSKGWCRAAPSPCARRRTSPGASASCAG